MIIKCREFSEETFNFICENLEKGKSISIVVYVVGPLRKHRESIKYKQRLKERYKTRLVQVDNATQEYTFRLVW